jgi:hypothetical protein
MSYSLLEDLQTPKNALSEFYDVTIRILGHISNVVDFQSEHNGYLLLSSTTSGQTKKVRPINKELFLNSINNFKTSYNLFQEILEKLKEGQRDFTKVEYKLIDSVVYTFQQTVGIGFDLLGESNSARKHVGNRFEDLIKILISSIGVSNREKTLIIPYSKKEIYRCQLDVVISPISFTRSDDNSLSEHESVISLKTSSKDRMSKIFVDNLLMNKFLKRKVNIIAIFLNDVQRKNPNKVSFTFVSNLFLVYSKFLRRLKGVYYVDPPSITKEKTYRKYIQPFSKFIIEDIWKLVNP